MASVYVKVEVKECGAKLIAEGTGASVRDGVEMLLKNDLCFGAEEVKPPIGAVDAGLLVQEGLTLLVNYPFDALDISIESETVDVRKAYKKKALKYHPDKNPRCTPLFLAIQNAHDRLTNTADREEEEKKQKQADASAAAQAKSKSKPPPSKSSNNPQQNTQSSSQQKAPGRKSSSPSSQLEEQFQKRAREKAEKWKREQEEREAKAARKKAEKEEAERKEAEAWVFPVPTNLQVVCINATTVQLHWSPPPACAYTRPPSYLRTELGWRAISNAEGDEDDHASKSSEWNLVTIMRDQTELVKDKLPSGEYVEFSLRFYIQPTVENQGQMIRGDWCDPVGLALPQSELPVSPKKAKRTDGINSTASLYHRFLRTVSSLRNDVATFDECQVDDDIVPDNWVSDDEGDSDDEVKESKSRPPLGRGNSFRELEVKWHQLIPPNSHMGSGRYVHSVYARSDASSPVIGYVTTARKVQAKLRKGEWILVQAHANSHCLGNTASSSFSGFPWGWVQRSQWIESLQALHVFLRPIPTSLKEVRKFKFLASVRSLHSLKEETNVDLNSTQQTETLDSIVHPEDEGNSMPSYNETAEEEVWYEQLDEASGSMYYYNSVTGESTWEAPEWVVEYDEYSGIRYFVKLDKANASPLHSKWSMPPVAFSKLVRLQATVT